jgi:hypothetical protein
MPQSATVTEPVMALDESDSKNKAILAISIGEAIRPSGVMLRIGDKSRPAASCFLMNGVSTQPGQIVLTRMFRLLH